MLGLVRVFGEVPYNGLATVLLVLSSSMNDATRDVNENSTIARSRRLSTKIFLVDYLLKCLDFDQYENSDIVKYRIRLIQVLTHQCFRE